MLTENKWRKFFTDQKANFVFQVSIFAACIWFQNSKFAAYNLSKNHMVNLLNQMAYLLMDTYLGDFATPNSGNMC